MKLVLFVHSLGGGGAERVTAGLANRWVERGWRVTVVTLTSADEDRYRLHPAVRRIGLGLAGASRDVRSAALENLRRLIALRRVLAAERPAVVLGMMTTASVLLALASLGLKGVGRIGSERVYPPRYRLGAPWEWLRARVYGWLDAIVVPAGEGRDWMLANTTARSVFVIPNPVVWPLPQEPPLVPPESVGLPARRRLLAVGRLEPQKGFDLLIEVFATIAPALPDWELVIIGEGPDRVLLERMIEALGLESVVHLAGRVGNMGDWYEHADLFVLSSRFEGFPNALLEAMAYGLPVVSVDCETGPREIVRQGVDGFLVAPGDAAALSGALSRLMRDDTTRSQCAERAREVRARFAPERVDALWSQLFADVGAGDER